MSEKKVPVKLKFSAAAASMLNSHDYYSEPLIKMPQKPTVTASTEKGYDHTPKSEEEKLAHKEHQKKLKAKRNAKKGIHAHKITYPKKRGA